MKKIIILALVIPFIYGSCNMNQEELEALNSENQELKESLIERDSTMNLVFASLNEIEDNLAEIKVRQNLIDKETDGETGIKDNIKDRIQEDLQVIAERMDKNRQIIASLNQQLKNSNLKIGEFEKMVQRLTDDIAVRDEEIERLKENLTDLNISVAVLNQTIDTLKTENQIKASLINDKVSSLNTAWYSYGSNKELREHNIITREGGFLGLGRQSKISNNLNKEYFTKIDITETKKIPVDGKDPKLISVHPSDSYEIKSTNESENLSQIEIKDENAFWSVSKYLVVAVN